jgi:hypothetical protein
MTDLTPTDWWQKNPTKARKWRAVGVSPLLRFMRYEKGGQHYAHYDAAYVYEDPKVRTLMSFVLYLTTNENGGATRFIRDGQHTVPILERNHADWDRPVEKDEVLLSVSPRKGRLVMFDHRLCHDVEPYAGNEPRIIIRGDVIYQDNTRCSCKQPFVPWYGHSPLCPNGD